MLVAMRTSAIALTVVCALFALGSSALQEQAAAATHRCDPETPGCQDLETLGQFTVETLEVGGRLKRAIQARARAASTSGRRRALAAETRRNLALTVALRNTLQRARARWRARTDNTKEKADGLQLLDASVGFVNAHGIAFYIGVLSDINRGAPIATTAAERARAAAATRRASQEARTVRATTAGTRRTVAFLEDDADVVRAWLRMRQNDDLLGRTMNRLIEPVVRGDRRSRRGVADVLEVFRRAHLNNAQDFRRSLAQARDPGRFESCRAAMNAYLVATIARDRTIARYAVAVRDGSARRIRTLFSLQRVLDRQATRLLGPAARCIRNPAPRPPSAGATGSINPIADISRSRVVGTSAASVQLVMSFPANSTLEVRIFLPDGSLVPGFNGPSPFPATVRTDGRGVATESFGIVRSTSPTGAWRVIVTIAGRPDLRVSRTFNVTD